MPARCLTALRPACAARLCLFATVVALSAPAGPASAAGVDEKPVDLEAAAVSFAPFSSATERFGGLEWRGGIEIDSDHENFGGYSGLVLSKDGTKLVAVSDRGWWFTADVAYDGDRLSGIANGRTARLLGPGGKRFKGNHRQDAEGLSAYGPKGTSGDLLVAFERRERILRYRFGRHGFKARPKTIRLPRDARRAKYNKELEAVARFGKGTQLAGTIIALSERFLDKKGNIRGWLIGGRRPGPIAIRRTEDFDITDMAILPGGDVLVLERRFSVITLAGMRIRRIAHKDIRRNAVLDGEVLLQANQPTRTIDNMEGIAVHRSPGGELRITIISDDNFNPVQRTLLLQFALAKD